MVRIVTRIIYFHMQLLSIDSVCIINSHSKNSTIFAFNNINNENQQLFCGIQRPKNYTQEKKGKCGHNRREKKELNYFNMR